MPHHVWRLNDLPWLSGPQVPRIFGPYQPICRDYSIEEFRGDIAHLLAAGMNEGPESREFESLISAKVNRPPSCMTRRPGFIEFELPESGL